MKNTRFVPPPLIVRRVELEASIVIEADALLSSGSPLVSVIVESDGSEMLIEWSPLLSELACSIAQRKVPEEPSSAPLLTVKIVARAGAAHSASESTAGATNKNCRAQAQRLSQLEYPV